ncbi:DUF421 domain-containing protein [Paenibacillus barcinonensis]|uniref:DUF421 domain-containing protein n=1 Tax=Paenibacillus barcinonensis TaxID=198119 RepID=A0A2V4VHC5_PAEBA|nr:DUF421 domain-containing protein [Paenibacillus barcinonensis]PYE45451.1 uncharacterized membrane protein YcaP (DUF421 family) [Paenibacillus barcinonensis]QKS55266.1 DUF421 domain-containing protein [Paenibacillus barcinonensis]
MYDHFIILIRSISAFLLLLVIARILGKQTLSNMNFHDFVTAVIMGAIAANLAFNEKMEVIHLIISLVVFTGTSYLLSKLNLRSRKIRLLAEGSPTVLIEGGKILEHNLSKNKMTLDSLNQALRQKEVFDINEVEYALLEVNGQISVMKKKQFRTITMQDMHKKDSPKERLPIEIIMDGHLLKENMSLNHVSQNQLTEQLKSQKKQISDVFYAVIGSNGKLYIDYYKDQLKHPVDVE